MIVIKRYTNGTPGFSLKPENMEDRDFLSSFIDTQNQGSHRVWIESYGKQLGAHGLDYILFGWMSEEKLSAARKDREDIQ